MTAVVERVNFPFAQALPAAASLWKLAKLLLDDVEPARQEAARTAMEQFRGNYAGAFLARMRTSGRRAEVTAQDLEQAAANIAEAWADANYQQQLYAYYAMVKAKRNRPHGLLTDLSDFLFGDHTNYGKLPARPAVPSPPDFQPTRVPQAHVPGESYVLA
jgi:hypothetical protein